MTTYFGTTNRRKLSKLIQISRIAYATIRENSQINLIKTFVKSLQERSTCRKGFNIQWIVMCGLKYFISKGIEIKISLK